MRIKLIVTTLLLLASIGALEAFEIAEPGKEFELYSEGHFKRKK